MKKAYNGHGVDWLEVVIPPEDETKEAEYTLRVHLTFLLSNWDCIFGRGCAGMFGVHSSTINDDAGCCVDSFYFSNKEEIDFVKTQMARLQPEDWDDDLRAHVEKNGFVHTINNSDDPEVFNAKGKVVDGACVFQNRNGGSSGHPGCAFHFLAEREGEEHRDVMPQVCWELPLRFGDVGNNVYELHPWDVGQWSPEDYQYDDKRYTCSWWCVDSPESYVGANPVYKSLEGNIRRMIGDRPYDLMVEAIEARLAAGNKYANMPGATVNDGRPLLPLLVGNRTPRREPSYFPEFLDKMKADTNGEQ